MRLSHVAWNLGGLSLPLGVAALTVPSLIATLGHERFGLLALAWGLIGYAGAMDLGLGRALTQMVARFRGERKLSAIPDVLMTAGRLTLGTGLVGGALIALIALAGGYKWIRVADTSPHEILISMILLAVALPAQAMSATYRGLNEAFLNFRGVSIVRATLGVVNFGGPYVVSLFTTQLPWLVASLVVSRLMALFVYRWLALRCLQAEPETRGHAGYSRNVARSLFAFGRWVTVSSIISPMLVQADRFVIASTVSAAAVSAYVLPYEVVVQSLILVGAVSSVMFPGLSKIMQEAPDQWRAYFDKWLRRVMGLMLVVCLALAALLPVVLPLWIGSSLNAESIAVGQVLCLGVFANAIGAMFYALLHAKGRADVTAKLHALELPAFLAVLLPLVAEMGILGAAWAWVGRMAVDALALALLAKRIK
ncbi:oligosaccharide flippase family protein [Variovorax sp. J22R24]|uniref:oligosaccharide flippase family protein n=1 Tax=Variovorax gracilis TaxID=3053502 RepID=UPI0025767CBA|nr:oligosaccharide flippase family protein [Variovorax sp. J22R24]MDM0103696.1 oligosaccharide flippase family protein [Variovorax sp. J22R24]